MVDQHSTDAFFKPIKYTGETNTHGDITPLLVFCRTVDRINRKDTFIKQELGYIFRFYKGYITRDLEVTDKGKEIYNKMIELFPMILVRDGLSYVSSNDARER